MGTHVEKISQLLGPGGVATCDTADFIEQLAEVHVDEITLLRAGNACSSEEKNVGWGSILGWGSTLAVGATVTSCAGRRRLVCPFSCVLTQGYAVSQGAAGQTREVGHVSCVLGVKRGQEGWNRCLNKMMLELDEGGLFRGSPIED